jgi:GH24 family phage-related lysozyme (muramidase)
MISFPGQEDLLAGKEDLKLGAQIPQPGGLNMGTKDYALDALKEDNPDFALTAFAEGLRLHTYADSAGKRTIGLGYNIDARSPEQVTKDFGRSGISADRVDDILAGKASITPREAKRLYEIVKPEYVSIAKHHFGEAWDGFPPNIKAVLTDMAYNGGNKLFGPIIDSMKAGKFDEAAQNVKAFYRDKDSGEMVFNKRRVNLWRGMMSGQNLFEQMVQQGA